MINSHSASTFAQITHRGVDSISNSIPTEIGICYCPIPISSIHPETSIIPGDNIPRCSACSGFFNKFNTIEKCDQINTTKFKCSLCGQITTTSLSLDIQNNHNARCILKNEVYEAFVSRNYFKRKSFIPTDFYIVSLDLLRSIPDLLDVICNAYSSCHQPKQVGIAFVHGAITVVKFRPNTTLQTFSDEVPIVKESQLFASSAYFRESLYRIKSELLGIQLIDNSEYSKSFVKFGISISSKFGSSLRFILNADDFHSAARIGSLRLDALNMCSNYSQASLCVFSDDEIKYKNPLVDLVSFTGGFLKLFKGFECDFKTELCSLLTPSLYHDAFLFVRPPDCGDIIDYAGYGFLKTNTGVCVSKVQAGDTFYFTINAAKISHPFIQFVIYYTTANNERKFRVSTLSLMTLPIINAELIRNFIAANVAQRIITEDSNSAINYYNLIKKKFSSFIDLDNNENYNISQQESNEKDNSGLFNKLMSPFSNLLSLMKTDGKADDFIPSNLNLLDKANAILANVGNEKGQYLSLYSTCLEYRSGCFLRRNSLSGSSSYLYQKVPQEEKTEDAVL